MTKDMYLWECEWGPLYKVVRTYCPNPILICTFLPLLQGLWLQCCVLKELKKMLQLMQIWAAYLLSREKEEEGASRKSWNHLPLSLLPFVDPSFFVFTLGLSPIKGAHPIEPTSCITWSASVEAEKTVTSTKHCWHCPVSSSTPWLQWSLHAGRVLGWGPMGGLDGSHHGRFPISWKTEAAQPAQPFSPVKLRQAKSHESQQKWVHVLEL